MQLWGSRALNPKSGWEGSGKKPAKIFHLASIVRSDARNNAVPSGPSKNSVYPTYTLLIHVSYRAQSFRCWRILASVAAPTARAPSACRCSPEFVRITGALATRRLDLQLDMDNGASGSTHENAAMRPSTEGALPRFVARGQNSRRECAAFLRCGTNLSTSHWSFAPLPGVLPPHFPCLPHLYGTGEACGRRTRRAGAGVQEGTCRVSVRRAEVRGVQQEEAPLRRCV